MYKMANVPRCNTLKIVIILMHPSLDEKSCTFYVNYFLIIPFAIFQICPSRKQIPCEILSKDPVRNIFTVYRPAKPGHSFRENFCS